MFIRESENCLHATFFMPGEFHLLYTQQCNFTPIKVTALFRGRYTNSIYFLFLCGFENESLNTTTPINLSRT